MVRGNRNVQRCYTPYMAAPSHCSACCKTHTTSVRLFTTPPNLARFSLRLPGRPIPCLAAARRFQAHRHRNQQDVTLRMLHMHQLHCSCNSCPLRQLCPTKDWTALGPRRRTQQFHTLTYNSASERAAQPFCNTDISVGVCYSIQCRHSLCSMHGPCSAILHRVCHRQQTSCTCAPGGEHRW
jgi:hypothetical protein